MIFEWELRNCPIRTKYLSYLMYKLAGFFPVQVQTHAKNLMTAETEKQTLPVLNL